MTKFVEMIFTNDSFAREYINGVWFFLGVIIITCIVLYLYRTWREEDNFRTWRTRIGIQMGIAWLFYMIGSVIRAGWVWVLLECQNRTWSQCEDIRDSFEVMFVAGAFSIAGGLCLIRIVTMHWNRWIWAFAGFVALVAPLIFHDYMPVILFY